MNPRERTLAGIAATALFIAWGCARIAVGVVMDEITVHRLMRDQRNDRGPANRDAREMGRTTSDDRGVW